MDEVLRLQQGQVGPGRREGRVRLALVELRLGQLDLPGADVVRDHQPGDVRRQVPLLDLGADGQRRPHDQAEFDLVVEEPDVGGPYDGLAGTADRTGRLAEEGGRDVPGEARITGVTAVVDHLGHYPAGGGDRREGGQVCDGGARVGRLCRLPYGVS